MEAPAGQSELFPDFPVIDGHAGKRSPVRQIVDATERHGVLLPPWAVIETLGMSKQRVHQLVQAGRIATVEVAGKTFVPAVALELFLSEVRKVGRPFKQAA
jgi:hypothetical protein